jgi:hypothetical protein
VHSGFSYGLTGPISNSYGNQGQLLCFCVDKLSFRPTRQRYAMLSTVYSLLFEATYRELSREYSLHVCRFAGKDHRSPVHDLTRAVRISTNLKSQRARNTRDPKKGKNPTKSKTHSLLKRMQITLQMFQENIIEHVFARSVRAPVLHVYMVSKNKRWCVRTKMGIFYGTHIIRHIVVQP